MKYLKPIGIFTLLLIAHLLLNSWGMLIVYALLGIGFPLLPGPNRSPLLAILLSELLIGVLVWQLAWANGQLRYFASNTQLGSFTLGGSIIFVNIVTAMLITGTCYYCMKLILHRRRAKNEIAINATKKEKVEILENVYTG